MLNYTLTRVAYRYDIQGLRALAIIFVICFHAGLPFPNGYLGVDIFFVVSGFVITRILVTELKSEGRINLQKFFYRRFKRLFPPLALMVTVAVLLSFILASPLGIQQNTAKTAISSITFSANFLIPSISGEYFGAPAEINPLLHTWSLSVEEQFYLFFPIFLIFIWRLKNSLVVKYDRLVPILLLCTISLLLAIFLPQVWSGSEYLDSFNFYNPIFRFWEFSVGSLAAIKESGNRLQVRNKFLKQLYPLVGFSLILLSLFLNIDGRSNLSIQTFIAITGTYILISAGGKNAKNSVTKLLMNPALARLGDMSYSLYLWHWPLISFSKMLLPDSRLGPVIALMVSFFPAWISYRLIETRIRKRDFIIYKKTRLFEILMLMGVPIVASICLGAVSKFYWSQKYMPPLPLVYQLGCNWTGSLGVKDPSICSWNTEYETKPIYLLGDSNAAHFVEGILGAARQVSRPLYSSTNSGCPFLPMVMKRLDDPKFGDYCHARFNRQLEWLKLQRAGTIIMASSQGYVQDSNYLVNVESGELTADPVAKNRQYFIHLTQLVENLKKLGHEVILVSPIPHFSSPFDFDPYLCTPVEIIYDGCTTEMPLASSTLKYRPVQHSIELAASKTDSQIVNVSTELCPLSICRGSLLKGSLYRDDTHISVLASEKLIPIWLVALKSG